MGRRAEGRPVRVRPVLVVATALVLALVAAGCGSADFPASASTSTTPVGPTPAQLEAQLDPTCVAGADVAPGSTVHVVDSGGVSRSYLQYIPVSYEGVGMPVVVNLHDAGATAALQDDASGLRDAADADGFVLLTPQGLGEPPTWDVNEASADVTFVADLLDQAATDFCLDPGRVYAVGAGHGGRLATRLACDLSDRVAAVAAVADLGPSEPCEQSRPVPLLAVYPTWEDVTQSVPSAELAEWAASYGCDLPVAGGPGSPTSTIPDTTSTSTVTTGLATIALEGCGGDAAVEYVEVPDGVLVPNAPVWPSTQTAAVDATIWTFLADHPLEP